MPLGKKRRRRHWRDFGLITGFVGAVTHRQLPSDRIRAIPFDEPPSTHCLPREIAILLNALLPHLVFALGGGPMLLPEILFELIRKYDTIKKRIN